MHYIRARSRWCYFVLFTFQPQGQQQRANRLIFIPEFDFTSLSVLLFIILLVHSIIFKNARVPHKNDRVNSRARRTAGEFA